MKKETLSNTIANVDKRESELKFNLNVGFEKGALISRVVKYNFPSKLGNIAKRDDKYFGSFYWGYKLSSTFTEGSQTTLEIYSQGYYPKVLFSWWFEHKQNFKDEYLIVIE